MSLLDVNLKQEYRSPRDNIVNDFYIPLLKEANLYKRSVGFFSSSSLLEISYGITHLINNNGKIQLIASPHLSEEDIEAINNGYDEKLTLDRIDNEKDYCPENCRWSTPKFQSNHKTNNVIYTFKGKTQTAKQWCDEYGISHTTLYDRLKRGWSLEQALTISTKGFHRKVK